MCGYVQFKKELSHIPIFKDLDKFHQITFTFTTFSLQLGTREYLKRLESMVYK